MFSLLLAFAVCFSATSTTWIYAGPEIGKAIANIFSDDLSEFTDSPGPIEVGSNPSRDEDYRNGAWDTELTPLLQNMEALESAGTTFPEASTADPFSNMGQHDEPTMDELPPTAGEGSFTPSSGGSGGVTTGSTTGLTTGSTTGSTTGATTGSTTGSTGGSTGGGGGSGGVDSGDGFPWEGHAPGGGSPGAQGTVNTNTGNRLTSVPIVSWDCVGSMSVDFTLYHNSRGVSAPFNGNKWRTSYDFYVYQDPAPVASGTKRTAIVRWPDGTYVPYVETAYGSNQYKGPAGIYEKLQRAPTGEPGAAWGLFQKDQTKYLFNSAGYLIRIKDRAGNTLNLSRLSNGQLLLVGDSSSRFLTFNYGSNGLLSSVVDPNSRTWTFAYDSSKNLIGVTYPQVNGTTYTRQFAYDTRSNITSERDLRNKYWNCTYDSSDRLTSWSNPLSHTVNFNYYLSQTTYSLPAGGLVKHNYSSGQLVSEVDPNNFSSAYGYDGNRNMSTVKNKRGGTWGYVYDANGNVLKEQDPSVYALPSTYTHQYTYNGFNDCMTDTNRAGHRREFVYNVKGGLQRVDYRPSAASGDVTALVVNTFDVYGQMTRTAPLGGKATDITYDSYGNVIVTEMSGGITTNLSYNNLGWLLYVQKFPDEGITYTRDNWGRVGTLSSPSTGSATITYNAEGCVTNVVDQNGHGRVFNFNDALWPTSNVNGRGDQESYGYNSNGWVTSITNGRGKTRYYEYTLRGDAKKITLSDGYFENSSFDANGNATVYDNSLLRYNSQQIAYTYNALDAVTNINYPSTADVSFAYDILLRTYSMTDGTGTTYWNYDEKERLSSLGLPGGGFTYLFDSSWRRSSALSSEGTTSYTYVNGDLATLTNQNGETTTWIYDTYSRLSRQTLANGSYTDYSYDPLGRNNSIVHKKSDNSVISQESYLYDPVGNMTSKTVDGVATTFGYDNADQLTSESRTGYSATYSYDGNGNRLSKVLNGVTEAYTYDDGDKMLTAGSKSYTHDLAGRTISVTGPGGTTNLAYDDEDRVTAVTGVGPNQTYTYNGSDTRTRKVYGGTTLNYKRNGVGPTAPVVSDGQAIFTPGISERRSGTSKFSHQDSLGSTKALTDSSQSVTDSRQFDAFGLLSGTTGGTPTPFGFAGNWGYQSDETGLQLLGHRYYDPSTGRFLTRDPIRSGSNWYTYADNNPVTFFDNDGLQKRRGRLRAPKEAVYEELVQQEVNGVIADAEVALSAQTSSTASVSASQMVTLMGQEMYAWFISLPPGVQGAVLLILHMFEAIAQEAAYGPAAGSTGHALIHRGIGAMAKAGRFGKGVEILSEESFYHGGKPASYGAAGSVRVDVIVKFNGEILGILDHKFGKAVLSEARKKALQGAVVPQGAELPPVFKTPRGFKGSWRASG